MTRPHDFKINDEVRFVIIISKQRSTILKCLIGRVFKFSGNDPYKVKIKYHSGSTVWRDVSEIRRKDQESPLRDIVNAAYKDVK